MPGNEEAVNDIMLETGCTDDIVYASKTQFVSDFISKSFKDFSDIPNWAKISLDNHKYDIRPYIYSLEMLEKAKTHDKLWNATQIQLIKKELFRDI
jgi:deoxyribodipyrimidine photo-lyase